MSSIAQNLERLQAQIKNLSDAVRLVAVSKTKPVTDILAAYGAGQRDFGENYAQELRDKALEVKPQAPDIIWHFIGHLQTNKVKYVVGVAEWIHSVDRKDLADEINKLASRKGIVQKALIEVQIAQDGAKTGCPRGAVASLIQHCATLPNLRIEGLMMMASHDGSDEQIQKEMQTLVQLKDELNAISVSPIKLRELSMGMSSDYPIAIACGSTMIRVGSLVFGART